MRARRVAGRARAPERGVVVRNVLEHGDRERGGERARCEREPLGRAAHPERALGDALGPATRRGDESLE